MDERLTHEEQQTLLRIAREAIRHKVEKARLPSIQEYPLTPSLRDNGASFITLTIQGELRGCIGTLEAQKPLAEDVQEHAVAAAFEDPRFPPLRESELNRIQIEVSRLTRPIPMKYKDSEDLLAQLRPHVHGVVLRDGLRRATFLPQVWEKIPDPADFLDQLCYKMGVDHRAWRKKHMDVAVYEVEEFRETNGSEQTV